MITDVNSGADNIEEVTIYSDNNCKDVAKVHKKPAQLPVSYGQCVHLHQFGGTFSIRNTSN